MQSNESLWKVDLKKMTCRNKVNGLEVTFFLTPDNMLLGIITGINPGIHEFILRLDINHDIMIDQIIKTARYYFAMKYYRTNNPYHEKPEMLM
jgi:hypothetical protein